MDNPSSTQIPHCMKRRMQNVESGINAAFFLKNTNGWSMSECNCNDSTHVLDPAMATALAIVVKLPFVHKNNRNDTLHLMSHQKFSIC